MSQHISYRLTGAAVALLLSVSLSQAANWPVPKVVNPGPVGGHPADAIVLFNGTSLSQWHAADGGPARWKIVDGAMQVVPGTGSLFTNRKFGACQLHIEWATPSVVQGKSQNRGNSGVYLQGRYEIQVLDSYHNPTYPDGQAGALYGNFPPLVNVCRPPGQWQTYDIVFHPPKLAADGKTIIPGSYTVFQNGVLVQDHVPVRGHTTASAFHGVTAKGPLVLQDHGHPVRFRNIWIRPLH